MTDEMNFNVPIRLNSFGETLRRIEDDRLNEAHAAVSAGWTPNDHPAKCCPHLLEPRVPQPKRADRSIEDIERLRASAQRKAEWWTDAMTRKQSVLDAREAARPRFDHGMLNTPVGPRAREAKAGDRLWRELEHANERRKHFERLEAKYANQIEKR